MNKREVGSVKEEAAAEYLKKQGYTIIEQNYYTPKGEIDLIAKEGEYLVFLEVKYRKTIIYGYPEEAIDQRKRNKIKNACRYYIIKNSIPQYTAIRFDVIVILGEEIKLIKNAFE